MNTHTYIHMYAYIHTHSHTCRHMHTHCFIAIWSLDGDSFSNWAIMKTDVQTYLLFHFLRISISTYPAHSMTALSSRAWFCCSSCLLFPNHPAPHNSFRQLPLPFMAPAVIYDLLSCLNAGPKVFPSVSLPCNVLFSNCKFYKADWVSLCVLKKSRQRSPNVYDFPLGLWE